MQSVNTQIETGNLVCPRTYQTLHRVDSYLETIDGQHKYTLVRGIPILFADLNAQKAYLHEQGGQMNHEYTRPKTNALSRWTKAFLSKDFRSQAALDSFYSIFNHQPADALCVAIGGGPRRHHPILVNLNIAVFENVDVVADAYRLPYADGTVEAVYIDAVLEHLEFPEQAVQEIFRVLKEGGEVYADTPFMQGFHGYPNHFQNFTLEGHRRLFSRNGFTILNAGTSVGPTYGLFSFLTHYIKYYLGFPLLKYPLLGLAYGLSILLKPFDMVLNPDDKACLLASTTFVYAMK